MGVSSWPRKKLLTIPWANPGELQKPVSAVALIPSKRRHLDSGYGCWDVAAMLSHLPRKDAYERWRRVPFPHPHREHSGDSSTVDVVHLLTKYDTHLELWPESGTVVVFVPWHGVHVGGAFSTLEITLGKTE